LVVVWRAQALADIARIIRYIAAENPSAASRLARDLAVAGDGLGWFPHRGRPGRHPGTREWVVTPNYLIVYRVDEQDRVTNLRVWHAAQDR
jgi:addiction module RelE/StbE family toxin